MITLRYHPDGRVEAIGRTRLVPEEHVLCEGSEDDVLRVLVSIYGVRPSNPSGIAGMLWREFIE